MLQSQEYSQESLNAILIHDSNSKVRYHRPLDGTVAPWHDSRDHGRIITFLMYHTQCCEKRLKMKLELSVTMFHNLYETGMKNVYYSSINPFEVGL